MKPYTYDEVMEQINHASAFGSLPGVENSRLFLSALGHPEQGMPFVHVAGTNGKGSVCAFLTQILMESGLRVGTFTSPHLIHFEERIAVNNVQILREDVTRLGNRLLEIPLAVQPAMFDYCLAMALLYFKEQGCELVVLETGLGGRLDSTNAVGVPEVTVITKIGYDHTAILGDTLEQIAGEKAGILKPGTYLVMERQEPEAAGVLRRAAADAAGGQGSLPYTEVGDADIAWVKAHPPSLRGTYQWENAAAAVLAARHLLGHYRPDWDTGQTDHAIAAGLAHTRWAGRMEQLSEEPFVLIDGAHNGHGVQALADSLRTLYPGERFRFVMGVMADKDYGRMVECLLPLAAHFATVTPENARALQAKELAAFIGQYRVPVESYDNIQDVVTDILHTPQHDDKIVAFGSLYFIGELKAAWEQSGGNL
jgi:dihydrofolate synthase/folylpolyglutamate synthase